MGIDRAFRFQVIVIAAATCLISAALALAATAAAGGWAVGSLDAAPAARAGTIERVGFTILQHGQTPAELDEGVGIQITNADGTTVVFAAVRDGLGHYVADVRFPSSTGDYSWAIRMGWFGSQDLGTLHVAPVPPTNWAMSAVKPIRGVLVAALAALSGVAIADALAIRRRKMLASQ